MPAMADAFSRAWPAPTWSPVNHRHISSGIAALPPQMFILEMNKLKPDRNNCQNILPTPEQTFQPRKLYLPALFIVAVILMLLVFIGFSTYWNLDRAQANALRFVHQRGAAILDVIENGIRSLGRDVDKRQFVNRMIRGTGKNEAVAYVYATDGGEILSRSETYSAGAFGVWRPEVNQLNPDASRMRRLAGGRFVYEIAKQVSLYPEPSDDADGKNQIVLVLGLNMQTFEAARHEDFHHAIIMVSILAALAAGTVFFIFVISRYHRMNRRLKQAQDYTRQVVDSMANGLLSIDADGRIISWNLLGLSLLGIQAPEEIEMHLDRVLDFESSGISETLATGYSVMDREITVALHDGQQVPVAVSVTPILPEPGRCEGAVVILRDLREIKRLEEKVRRTEKLAALGKMAAAVAHEIRNPLSSIRGFAQFLRQVLQDREKEQEYAATMVREVDRINRVVTDLLNFARPLELEPRTSAPVDLIAHTVRLVEADAAVRGVDIKMHTENGPETAVIDPNLMTQVLLNLMLNAMQAVEEGGRVDVGVRAAPEEGQIIFQVEDNGPGIDETNRNRIFDPFFTTREKGTGLGLAIVQKIVENHQGNIRVESPVPETGRGCRFTIRIPDRL